MGCFVWMGFEVARYLGLEVRFCGLWNISSCLNFESSS